MTLQDIMKSLYFKKETYFVDMFGKIKCNQTTLYNDRNNCSSREHIERWLLMNDLLNVACFLNKDWHPNWDDDKEEKYIITIENKRAIPQKIEFPASFIYFPSAKTAQQAIDIMGKDQLIQILEG